MYKRQDGEFIVNPNQEQWDNGDLRLTVASTREKVIMIEAGANELPEDKMIEAIYKCHEVNQTIIRFVDQIVAEVGKPKHEYTSCAIPEEMFAAIKEICLLYTSGGVLKIGYAFSFQLVQRMEAQEHDVALDALMTEKGINFFG